MHSHIQDTVAACISVCTVHTCMDAVRSCMCVHIYRHMQTYLLHLLTQVSINANACAVQTHAARARVIQFVRHKAQIALLGMIIGYLVMDHLERDASQSEEVRHLIFRWGFLQVFKGACTYTAHQTPKLMLPRTGIMAHSATPS